MSERTKVSALVAQRSLDAQQGVEGCAPWHDRVTIDVRHESEQSDILKMRGNMKLRVTHAWRKCSAL